MAHIRDTKKNQNTQARKWTPNPPKLTKKMKAQLEGDFIHNDSCRQSYGGLNSGRISQDNHPELRKNEVFFSNSGANEDYAAEHPEFKTMRKGKVAYSSYGEKLNGDIPWFMSGDERQAYYAKRAKEREENE